MPRKRWPPTVPVTLTGTWSPSDRVSSTAIRLNFTIRSGTPLPSWSPRGVGDAGASGTDPLSRTDEMSMSLATKGGGGSRKPVIQKPREARSRALGVKSNAIGMGAEASPNF